MVCTGLLDRFGGTEDETPRPMGETSDDRGMTSGQRLALGATGLAVGVLAGGFSFLSWDRVNQFAGVVPALVAVVALGASVWAALAGPSRSSLQVSGTGRATATAGGKANSGAAAPLGGSTAESVVVERTGEARADGGSANTGYERR